MMKALLDTSFLLETACVRVAFGGRSLAGGCGVDRSEYIVRCFGDGQVETDPLSCFNRTAILIHDPFDIGFGRSSSAVQCHQIGSNCKEQIKMAQKISPRLTLL